MLQCQECFWDGYGQIQADAGPGNVCPAQEYCPSPNRKLQRLVALNV